MLLCSSFCSGLVAFGDGSDDFLDFGDALDAPLGTHDGTPAQRGRKNSQLAQDTEGNRIARSGADTVIEIAFAGDDFLGIAVQISFLQTQEMGFQGFDLCIRRILDELFDDQRFEHAADAINILRVLRRHGDHGKAAIVSGADSCVSGPNGSMTGSFILSLAMLLPALCCLSLSADPRRR
jgi:hypothetical protein